MSARHTGRAGATPPRRDWVSKTLAGALLGLLLGFGVSLLLAVALRALPLSVRGQLAMWSVAPVWLLVWGGVYFFSSGRRAWAWLRTAGVLVLGAGLLLRPLIV